MTFNAKRLIFAPKQKGKRLRFKSANKDLKLLFNCAIFDSKHQPMLEAVKKIESERK
ncbi:hypothetical protein PT2222_70336 [Paraburkholderia tropica]